MRPRGTPPTPSARSSDSAPVGIASTGTCALSPSRITRARAELALDLGLRGVERRVLCLRLLGRVGSLQKFFRLLPSQLPFSCRVGSSSGPWTRTPRPMAGETNGRARPGRHERAAAERRGAAPGLADPHRPGAAPPPLLSLAVARTALGAHPRDRHVGPEVALLGLVEAGADEPRLDLGLKLDRARALGLDREQARPPARRPRDGFRQQPQLRAPRRRSPSPRRRSPRCRARAGSRGRRASRAASPGAPGAARRVELVALPCGEAVADVRGRSSATKRRARGLFRRCFATAPNLRR